MSAASYGLLLKATSEHERPAARAVHGLLIAALTALVRAIRPARGSEGLLYLPCGAAAADLEQMAQSEALQRLWS